MSEHRSMGPNYIQLEQVRNLVTEELPSIFQEIERFACFKRSKEANRVLIKNKGQRNEEKICIACYCELYLANENWNDYEGIVHFHKISLEENLNCDKCGEKILEVQPAKHCDECKQLFLWKEEELFEKASLYVEAPWDEVLNN